LTFFVIGFGTDATRRTTDATTVARAFRRERDRSNASVRVRSLDANRIINIIDESNSHPSVVKAADARIERRNIWLTSY